MQDTHFTNDDLNFITSQWGYKLFHSPGTRDSRGVAILFNNNFEYTIIEEKKDDIGNMIWLEIEIEKKFTVNLVNIYGPNKDSPQFYKDLNDSLTNSNNDFTVICGDFNLVQDFDVDCFNYSTLNNPKARLELLNLKQKHNLHDPWRIYHPNVKTYTWFRKNPIKKSRLDFFLISEELLSMINNVNINPGYRTDHSSVELDLRLSDFTTGKGFWKFNNLLFKDKKYIAQVKEIIHSVIQKYGIPFYNFKNINNIPNHEIQFVLNDQQFFEQLLLEIRGMSITYAIDRKKKQKLKETELLKQIKLLETILSGDTSVHTILSEILDEHKRQLENIRNEKMKGILLRSRANWIEHGEKPSKYFCSLEKRNFINKNVTKVIDNDGNIHTDQKIILNQIANFYRNLYSNRDAYLTETNLTDLLPHHDIPKLSPDESNRLEGLLTHDELLHALKSMKNGKSPGSDGFTIEFYKFFWNDIGYFLLRSLNHSFYSEELSITQKQGIISIIPKGQKPREYLKNWRPISLLNNSYKLLSSCLANRLKQILAKLIHENQKGFLSGRYIGENTRLVYDILNYTEQYNKPGILLLVDFEKAFDPVSWKFL